MWCGMVWYIPQQTYICVEAHFEGNCNYAQRVTGQSSPRHNIHCLLHYYRQSRHQHKASAPRSSNTPWWTKWTPLAVRCYRSLSTCVMCLGVDTRGTWQASRRRRNLRDPPLNRPNHPHRRGRPNQKGRMISILAAIDPTEMATRRMMIMMIRTRISL